MHSKIFQITETRVSKDNYLNKNKIKNLEESIEYLKKAIDEFQNMK